MKEYGFRTKARKKRSTGLLFYILARKWNKGNAKLNGCLRQRSLGAFNRGYLIIDETENIH